MRKGMPRKVILGIKKIVKYILQIVSFVSISMFVIAEIVKTGFNLF